MANQLVSVLSSLISAIHDNDEAAFDRARQIANAIKELQASVESLRQEVAGLKVGQSEDISDKDAQELMTQLKAAEEWQNKPESAPKVAPKASETPKTAPKAAPKAKAEPTPEPVAHAQEPTPAPAPAPKVEPTPAPAPKSASDVDELKSIFFSKSTGRQRIICMNYLKLAGRKSECRMPDKLTWEHCATVQADESSDQSALDQWVAFVVDYDKTNG